MGYVPSIADSMPGRRSLAALLVTQLPQSTHSHQGVSRCPSEHPGRAPLGLGDETLRIRRQDRSGHWAGQDQRQQQLNSRFASPVRSSLRNWNLLQTRRWGVYCCGSEWQNGITLEEVKHYEEVKLCWRLGSVFILTAIVCGSRNMAAQATRPKAQRASSAAKVTPGRGAAFIRIAWRNLARAYQELLNTPGDVKGDTSRLEGALGAAIDDLHQLDPSFAAASPAPRTPGSREDTRVCL